MVFVFQLTLLLWITEVMTDLYNLVDESSGIRSPMISEKYWKIIHKNASTLDSAIAHERDFYYNYFGFKVTIITYNLSIIVYLNV